VDGRITDVVDIRKPVGLEMEFEVYQPGHILMPNFNIYNEEGVFVFSTKDHDPDWRRRPRPTGRYISTAWIPGNLLAEGIFFVGPTMMTIEPIITHFQERDAVAFQVVDSHDGDSARGDWVGDMKGVVRPLLKWTTQYSQNNAGVLK
jgi:lipopolysaccharide transport system ATP-binding protein